MEKFKNSEIVGLSRTISKHGKTILFVTAEGLIRIGVRPPQVASCTGIPSSRAINMWHEIHDESPPCGQIADYAVNLLKTRKMVAHATLFAQYYFREGGHEIYKEVVPAAIISAYLAYTKSVDDPLIYGELGYFIARDLVKNKTNKNGELVGSLELRICNQCKSYYLFNETKRTTEDCCFCYLMSVGFK